MTIVPATGATPIVELFVLRIDEEGCGAFFAAARAWTDAE